MYSAGPHRFSPTDAQKTFANLGVLWGQLTEGRDATATAPVASTLVSAFASALGTAPDLAPGDEHVMVLRSLGEQAAAALQAGRLDPVSVERLLEAVMSGLQDASSALRDAGQLPATVAGTVRASARLRRWRAETPATVGRDRLPGRDRRPPEDALPPRPTLASAQHLERRGDRCAAGRGPSGHSRIRGREHHRRGHRVGRGPRRRAAAHRHRARSGLGVRTALPQDRGVVPRSRHEPHPPRPRPGQPRVRDGAGTGKRRRRATRSCWSRCDQNRRREGDAASGSVQRQGGAASSASPCPSVVDHVASAPPPVRRNDGAPCSSQSNAGRSPCQRTAKERSAPSPAGSR